MAWRVNGVIEQRKLFIKEYLKGERPFSDLCSEFDISRPIGYKWLRRYQTEGEEGLLDRSRARHTQTAKTDERLEEKILAVKQQFKSWGPKKIYAHLNRHEPNVEWPSLTTFGNVLQRHGHVSKRKRRKRLPIQSNPLSHCQNPNDVWCVDFKGWFLTKDNVKCDPFTVTDAYSRFILYCSKIHSCKMSDVWATLDRLFYENGLPCYLRSDNGPPFATKGAGRLSALSVKLIKAGVMPEWIDPGKPHQNGRHERMHLTVQNEAAYPLILNLDEQQMKFVDFIQYYNHIRPHEGIGQKVPGDIYIRSEKEWNGILRPPEYGEEYLVKRVRTQGQIAWKNDDLYIGKALGNEYIGLKESGNDEWLVYYGPILLGSIDYTGAFNIPRLPSRVKRAYKDRCY